MKVVALLAISAFITLGGCRFSSFNSSGDDLDAVFGKDTGKDTQSHEAELHGIPSVQQPPPVIPEASGRLSMAGVTGPRNPQLAWGVSLPLPQATIHQIGVDGTIYVTGYNTVGAVRDGKLLWAFRVHQAARPTMADDGRIWFKGYERSGYFCLNRLGQGGLLPTTYKPPLDAQEKAGSGCNNRDLVSEGRIAATLNYECLESAVGPDGASYVSTSAPDIRAFTPTFAPQWELAVPCSAESLLAGPGKRVLFSCKNRSIHYVQNGVLGWAVAGDGKMQSGVRVSDSNVLSIMDGTGTSYFVDQLAKGISTEDDEDRYPTHIHALSATGQWLWTRRTRDFSVRSIKFDSKGHVCLTGSRGMHEWLICISD